MPNSQVLPVDEVLPALRHALAERPCAVLQAPPGAGKTTRVPLALLAEPWLAGNRIVMLEPRRLAVRAAARYMAAMLGEETGDSVGYRVRFDARVSARTRVEVVTEGVLTRRLQAAPDLPGVGLLIFDEFHERSLEADLGLALARDSQRVLRPDLKLLVMSATIDGTRVAALLDDAPVLTSAGRSHPVTIRHLHRPARPELVPAMAAAIGRALDADTGSVLAFLPGEGEIRRLAGRLAPVLPSAVDLRPLYGALPAAAQDLAVRPAAAGRRKVVLATTIAETSLTIDGVGVVVDSGLKRVPRFDPRSGMSRLTTVQVSRAAAEQRAGRAGRTAAGVCYRLWSEAEQRGLAPFDAPEIAQADLAPLALALADWGAREPGELQWLDPPPPGPWAQAVELLQRLRALQPDGAISPEGRAMAALPLHPRLAHMVQQAGDLDQAPLACLLAALLSERDPLPRGSDPDLRLRLEGLLQPTGGEGAAAEGWAGTLARIRAAAGQVRRAVGVKDRPWRPDDAGRLLALAYPDRVAGRAGPPGRYRLSGGGSARLDASGPLAAADFLAVAGLTGTAGDAWIALAAPLDAGDIDSQFAADIVEQDEVIWDPREARVLARRQRRLGDLALQTTPVARPATAAVLAAMLDGVRSLGLEVLPWTPDLRQWQRRVLLLRRLRPADGWPDVSDATLMSALDAWLAPFLTGVASKAQLAGVDLAAALQVLLPWPLPARLQELAPVELTLPSGTRRPLHYTADGTAVLRLRLQQAFGMTQTPVLAEAPLPVVLELLSPADRPLARTADLTSFWAEVYPQVRAEMRGRYPKHRWPEDPLTAVPG